MAELELRGSCDHRTVANLELPALVVTLERAGADCRERAAVGGRSGGMCGGSGADA